MKANKQLYVVLGLIVIVLLAFFYFFAPKPKKKIRWVESYEANDKSPFGSYLAAQLLTTFFEGESFDFQEINQSVTQELPLDSAGNYIFIGEEPHYSQTDEEALIAFIAQGNFAFISSEQIPSIFDSLFYKELGSRKVEYSLEEETEYEISDSLIQEIVDKEQEEDELYQSLIDSSEIETDKQELVEEYADDLFEEEEEISFYYDYPQCFYLGQDYDIERLSTALHFGNSDTESSEENILYFPSHIDSTSMIHYELVTLHEITDFACEEKIEVIGTYDSGNVNMIVFQVGEGTLVYHSQPIFFTNYFLAQSEGLAYFEKVLSLMPEADIYWDQISQQPQYSEPKSRRRSPLTYILSQPSLRWAWYLILSLTLLYLIFTSRRKQRMIPFIKPPQNSSIAYAQTIGRLYMNERDHKRLVELKMKLFLDQVKTRFNLHFHEVNEEVIHKIKLQSKLKDSQLLDDIFNFHQSTTARSEKVTNQNLVDFVKKLDAFWKEVDG